MKIGRNQICPFCNSGKKYKKCCQLTEYETQKAIDSNFDKWFEDDLKLGQKRIEEMEKE